MKEPISKEPEKTTVSRKRKIIVLIFVIGFWIFYYWYQGSQTSPPATKTSSEIQKETNGTNP